MPSPQGLCCLKCVWRVLVAITKMVERCEDETGCLPNTSMESNPRSQSQLLLSLVQSEFDVQSGNLNVVLQLSGCIIRDTWSLRFLCEWEPSRRYYSHPMYTWNPGMVRVNRLMSTVGRTTLVLPGPGQLETLVQFDRESGRIWMNVPREFLRATRSTQLWKNIQCTISGTGAALKLLFIAEPSVVAENSDNLQFWSITVMLGPGRQGVQLRTQMGIISSWTRENESGSTDMMEREHSLLTTSQDGSSTDSSSESWMDIVTGVRSREDSPGPNGRGSSLPATKRQRTGTRTE